MDVKLFVGTDADVRILRRIGLSCSAQIITPEQDIGAAYR